MNSERWARIQAKIIPDIGKIGKIVGRLLVTPSLPPFVKGRNHPFWEKRGRGD
jgi:hypothetical protein